MTSLSTLQVWVVGVCFGLLPGVLLGRWSLLLLWRRAWRRLYLRQLTRTESRGIFFAPAAHAGRYVEPGRYGYGSLTPLDSWSPGLVTTRGGPPSVRTAAAPFRPREP